ncbi:uncharacterized protein Mb2253c-like [Juglans microcarpa x Juglans regia]|uniref:uncharacterized protein Mb2253c-like n=1 Tax=Juglans microcarpa x Juglans regia TaxID=2249226 RepID=UPI001B7E60A9|nr:uncharacterized protein Mb2253c-like [Juglans microcarpa x Juglans regia]
MKGRAPSDFIVKFTDFPEEVANAPIGKPWQVFVGGSSCRTKGGVGVHIIGDSRHEHHYMVKLTAKTTNNEAKYEALVAGLSIAEALGVTEVKVKVDSQVVVNQVLGVYKMKSKNLKKYLQLAWEKRDQFCHFSIEQIPRESNNITDKLA